MARPRATSANMNNSNKSNTQRGRETGVQVPTSRVAIREDGMESPSEFFNAAFSPAGGESAVSTSTEQRNQPEAVIHELEARKKTKKRIRFSIDGEGKSAGRSADGDDDDDDDDGNYAYNEDEKKEADGSTTTYQQATQKIGRHVARLRSAGRTSIDTADLSTVTTAPAESPPPPPEEAAAVGTDDEEEVEPTEEKEGAAAEETEEVALAHQRNRSSPSTTTELLDNTDQSIPLQDYGNVEEEFDDLLPPPPPPETSLLTQEEMTSNKEPARTGTPTFGGKSPRSAMKQSPVSFTANNTGTDDDYDDDDDDDKEGTGFQMSDVHTRSGSSKKKGGTPSRSTQKLPTKKKQDEFSDDDEIGELATKKSTRSRKKVIVDSSDDADEEVDTAKSTRAKRARLNRSVDSSRSIKPVASKKKKGKRVYDTSDDEDATALKAKKKKARMEKNKGKSHYFASQGIAQPHHFTVIPMSDLKPEETKSPNIKNLRRSKRVRIQPLEFWRGECVEYGQNDFPENDKAYDGVRNMSVPKYVRKTDETPYKPRKLPPPRVVSTAKKGKKGSVTGAGAVVEVLRFDDANLRKKYHYKDGDKANLWDSVDAHAKETVAVARAEKFKFKDLPMTRERKSSEGAVVGKAAQAFYVFNKNNRMYPGYIMGKLLLPPKGIKDAECVGSCAQTFTVISGQPGSLELAYADPNTNNGKMNLETASRFLLGPGDVFRVPPGNCYRLQNHAKKQECIMTWTIIRPTHNYDSE